MSLRILWSSNALWASTGYGIQAKYLLPRLQDLGCVEEIRQFAWYGLQGNKLQVPCGDGKMTVYPARSDPWGNDVIGAYVQDMKANLCISLQDIWVLPPDYRKRVGCAWAPWFPVDHQPIPPLVAERARMADFPITYSAFGKREADAAGVPNWYIPHGVDVDVFNPGDKAAAREKYKLPQDAYIIDMVAANKAYPSRKSLPECLQAFSLFHARHPESLLYIHTDASGSAEAPNLYNLVSQLGLTDSVRFPDELQYTLGFPDVAIADLYRASDVHLTPSMNEGFGIPILEAQACGTPVITTDFTSMTELTWAGYAIPPAQLMPTPLDSWVAQVSVASIDEALERVYQWTPEERERKTARAIDKAQEYAWDTLVTNYWQPFLEMVDHVIHRTIPRPAVRVEGDSECEREGHKWAKTGLYAEDGIMCVPCLRKDCPAERRVYPSGSVADMPTGFEMIVNGVALDIEDDPEGGVAKIVAREMVDSYKLDSIPFEPGDAVIDIGAHVGVVSVYLAKKHGVEVWAFEPVPENVGWFRRNIKANASAVETGWDIERIIRVYPFAVTADGRRVDTPSLPHTNSGGWSIFGEGLDPFPKSTFIWHTIDDLPGDNLPARIKLLKIDCEGAEYEILTSAPDLLDRVDYLVGEFHRSEALEAQGYTPESLLALVHDHIPPERVHMTVSGLAV